MKFAPALTLAVGGAIFLGIGIPFFGTFLSQRLDVDPIRLIPLLGGILVGAIAILAIKDPRRYIFLALIAGLPYVTFGVPSGRILNLSLFDVGMLAVAIITLISLVFSDRSTLVEIFPSKTLVAVLLLTVPSVLFSSFIFRSAWTFVDNFLLYLFFIYACMEVRRPGGVERLIKLFAFATAIISAGIFLELIGVNVGPNVKNINTLDRDYRASGFFGDPQMAGQFLGCATSFMFVLALRKYFDKRLLMQSILWLVAVIGSVAMLATGSRASFGSAILFSFLALLLLNRWSWGIKIILVTMFIASFALLIEYSSEILTSILPSTLVNRISTLDSDMAGRIHIWFDTWDMFELNPIQGIGLGAFQDYFIHTRPWTRHYYGIGQNLGIEYIPDQPENGYFKILYEGGILGSTAALILIGFTLWHATRVLRFGSPKARTESAAAVVALFVYGGAFLTLFTFSDERSAVVFILPLAIIWGRSVEISRASTEVHAHQGKDAHRALRRSTPSSALGHHLRR